MLLRSKYGVDVFIEPGAAFVRDAGYIDRDGHRPVPCDGREIAVLDTTVNHMPEVFEYQFEPEVLGHDDEAEHEYILAGSTCLAGDVFGLYGFDEPLEIGSRVVFAEAGAYTTVKSHMFNGINFRRSMPGPMRETWSRRRALRITIFSRDVEVERCRWLSKSFSIPPVPGHKGLLAHFAEHGRRPAAGFRRCRSGSA